MPGKKRNLAIHTELQRRGQHSFELNEKLAAIMSSRTGYTVTITELHHKEKLDAPSGTAINLAEQIIQANPGISKWTLGKSDDETTISIMSVRETGVPGTHVIHYEADEDEITVIHKAHNRKALLPGHSMQPSGSKGAQASLL